MKQEFVLFSCGGALTHEPSGRSQSKMAAGERGVFDKP